MANVRTLKLNLLGDVSQFRKSFKQAENETQTFSQKVGSFAKTAAKNFALMGAAAATAAVAFGVDSVKAAIEDDKAQKKLQNTLKNTTKATVAQRKAVENYISKAQLTFGFVDDKLRPAFARLSVATGSISKSQELLNLAMNVSAGTGKDLETVTNAIAKAYGGNLGALKKLGINVSDVAIKTKDFATAQKDLNTAYSGSAMTNAKTFAGRMEILKIRFGEFKESVGYKLIPVLTKTMDFIEERVIPILGLVADGFNGKDGVNHGVKSLGEIIAARNIGKALRDMVNAAADLFGAFGDKKDIKGAQDFSQALQQIADGINAITTALKLLKPLIDIGEKFIKYGPNIYNVLKIAKSIGSIPGNIAKGFGGLAGARAAGGPVAAGGSYLVGERGPEIVRFGQSGYVTPNNRIGGNTFIFNGIVDAESARRSIERVLQSSSVRTQAVQIEGSLL